MAGATTGKRVLAQQAPSSQPSAAIEMVSANGRIDLGVGCASLRPPARKTPHQARCRFPSKLENLQEHPTARQQQKARVHSERGLSENAVSNYLLAAALAGAEATFFLETAALALALALTGAEAAALAGALAATGVAAKEATAKPEAIRATAIFFMTNRLS